MTQPSRRFSAPYVYEFPFKRTVGPVVGKFFAGLANRMILGARTKSGRVLVPPLEFDPATAEPIERLVEVGQEGDVIAWTWVKNRPSDHLDSPFAWALVKLDGADSALFHAVNTRGDDSLMQTGMRVRAQWRHERTGDIQDIYCFEPVPHDIATGRGTSEEPTPRSLTGLESIQAPFRIEYTMVAGDAESAFLAGLNEGKLIGGRCAECDITYMPAPSFCSRCMAKLEAPFVVTGTGSVDRFTVVHLPFPGQELTPPYVVAEILIDGTDSRLTHLLDEVDPRTVEVGMRVEPVWRETAHLEPSLRSIRYFRPHHPPSGKGSDA